MKKRKPTSDWMAYRIAGPKAQRLGIVEGSTEQEALENAYRTFKITSEDEKKRIILHDT
jgi:hypothetical protein